MGAVRATARVVLLATPPLPCLAPAGTFDAFGWCVSDWLAWASPRGARGQSAWDTGRELDGRDPARMVFVLGEGAAPYLPRELAALHAFGLGLTDEPALSPWAIDDATDQLFAHRTPPREALWLAADNLNALFWGLHDWAHFHNHGAFEPHQRPWTELQCDASALAWLWHNRHAIPLDEAAWARARLQVVELTRGRFREAGRDAREADEAVAHLEGEKLAGYVRAGDCERTTRS